MKLADWFVAAGRKGLALFILAAAIVGACPAMADCTATNLGIVPAPELGLTLYKGVAGGLYPNGANGRPTDHEAAGLSIATNEVLPRDASGNVETNSGRIVLLSIGMSNTTQEWGQGFMPLAANDPSRNPQLVIVDGAQGGQAATDWTNFNSVTWTNVETRLRNAGVTTNQVQIIWMKHARRSPTQAFPLHAQLLQTNLEAILRVARQRYPNLKMAYLSSRTRSYETNAGRLNPEPFAYESAFSVRWLIEKQLNGELNYSSSNGAVVMPWLSWGPYLWADGTGPRSDGFTWPCSDLQTDFTHPSTTGRRKVGDQLLAFFKTDATATPWFLRKTVVGQPPVCAPTASATGGTAPLTVSLSANATDVDGTIRDYQWTFEDGTFSTNANPTKVFYAPGVYRARLTVTDNSGNTAHGIVTIEVAAATLGDPSMSGSEFQCAVQGSTNNQYVVERSDELTSWIAVATNRGPFTFMDSNGALRQFFRVLVRP